MVNYGYLRTGKRIEILNRADHGHDLYWIRSSGNLYAVPRSTLVSSTTLIRFYRALTLATIVTLAIAI